MTSGERARPKRVFLSYSVSDLPFARQLSEALEATGASVVDPSQAGLAGDRWGDHVLDHLRTADFLVFILPRAGFEASWQLSELGSARALHKPIVPVMREPAWYPTGAIASALSGGSSLDASRFASFDDLAQAIVNRGTAALAA